MIKRKKYYQNFYNDIMSLEQKKYNIENIKEELLKEDVIKL